MTRAQLTSTVEQNSGGAVAPYVAGKNKIINGDFGIWARGTSFTSVPSTKTFTADRLYTQRDGTGATVDVSQQTFTPGTAPVSGYEGTYFLRFNQSVAGSGSTYNSLIQKIEDVRIFAGQTVTFSFWAKASSSLSIPALSIEQNFAAGGSATVSVVGSAGFSLTTSWQRFSTTFNIPSISGKTVGTNSALMAEINFANNTVQTIDIWGVQLEAGSVATPFTTATGTLQGELALCQRYLPAVMVGANNRIFGVASNTTNAYVGVTFPVTARVAPTGITTSAVSGFTLVTSSVATGPVTAIGFDSAGINSASLAFGVTLNNPVMATNIGVDINSSSGSYILFTGCEL